MDDSGGDKRILSKTNELMQYIKEEESLGLPAEM